MKYSTFKWMNKCKILSWGHFLLIINNSQFINIMVAGKEPLHFGHAGNWAAYYIPSVILSPQNSVRWGDYPHFVDEETEAERWSQRIARGSQVRSHICLTSKPTSFPLFLCCGHEMKDLSSALQQFPTYPLNSGEYQCNSLEKGTFLWLGEWLKYLACLGDWEDYGCRVNLAAFLLYCKGHLAVVPDKHSNFMALWVEA